MGYAPGLFEEIFENGQSKKINKLLTLLFRRMVYPEQIITVQVE